MSRRKGINNFAIQKEQKKIDLKRAEKLKTKLVRIIIACEDSKIAPSYFKIFFDYLIKEHNISAESFVIAKHNNTHPTGVLEDLENYKGKNSDTYKNFDHKWIVIDRDEERTNGGGHTLEDYNAAILRAKKLKVKVAYSNPAFEIWYLLHFQYQSAFIDRDAVNKKLKQRNGYDKKEEIAKNMYELLSKKQQNFAIENAKKLIKQCEPENIEHCNPSTTVHELVELLGSYQENSNDVSNV